MINLSNPTSSMTMIIMTFNNRKPGHDRNHKRSRHHRSNINTNCVTIIYLDLILALLLITNSSSALLVSANNHNLNQSPGSYLYHSQPHSLSSQREAQFAPSSSLSSSHSYVTHKELPCWKLASGCSSSDGDDVNYSDSDTNSLSDCELGFSGDIPTPEWRCKRTQQAGRSLLDEQISKRKRRAMVSSDGFVNRFRRLIGLNSGGTASPEADLEDGDSSSSSESTRASISNLMLVDTPREASMGHRNASQPRQQQPGLVACQPRTLEFKATKVDANGHWCSGKVLATICHGQCESGEYADWQFPYKKSIHRVCGYGERVPRQMWLSECSSDEVDPSAKIYKFMDAVSCSCQVCSHHNATCISLITTPHLTSRQARRRKKVSSIDG